MVSNVDMINNKNVEVYVIYIFEVDKFFILSQLPSQMFIFKFSDYWDSNIFKKITNGDMAYSKIVSLDKIYANG
jgi:hypothetical protein